MADKARCENCYYSVEHEWSHGDGSARLKAMTEEELAVECRKYRKLRRCRRYPPQFYVVGAYNRAEFSLVSKDAWCGEWRLKDKPSITLFQGD